MLYFSVGLHNFIPINRDLIMRRLVLHIMLIVCICSCEKDSSISEKYVGNWEGTVYAIVPIEDGDRNIAVVSNIIELTIEQSSSYTCVLYDFQSPGGIPIKVGEGFVSKGTIIEEGESISFNNTWPNIKFTSIKTTKGRLLESAEYMIELKKQ